jgi:hypothetical protein
VAGSSAAPSVLGRVGSILSSPAGLAGIGTAGSLIGAGIQSSGISKAAEIEAQFQREALAYEKQRDQYLQNLEAQRYGELNQRLQPYMDLGTTRGDKLAALLGVNPASYQYGTEAGAEQPPAQTWPGVNQATYGAIQPTQANFRPRPPGVPSEGTAVPRPGTMGGQTVMVRAPTGETRQLSPEQAQQAVARGAQIVSG